MARQIFIRPPARQDLIDQYLFIAQGNGEAADRFLEMTDETLSDLSQMSEMGNLQKFRNPKLANVRKWRVRHFEKHLIFYRPIESGIEILRIIYATRDIEALFEE